MSQRRLGLVQYTTQYHEIGIYETQNRFIVLLCRIYYSSIPYSDFHDSLQIVRQTIYVSVVADISLLAEYNSLATIKTNGLTESRTQHGYIPWLIFEMSQIRIFFETW